MSVAAPPAPAAREVIALADALRPALMRLSRRLRNEAQRAGMSAQDAIVLGLVKAHPGIGVSGLAEANRSSRGSMQVLSGYSICVANPW